jgi:hypothetical protein
MYDGPSFVEFYLKDIDSVLQELKQEREELKELLEGVKAEQQGINHRNKLIFIA